jgi:LPXTG-site transpeptidase (sortase) family protein
MKVILRLTGNLLLGGSLLSAVGLAVLVFLPDSAEPPLPWLNGSAVARSPLVAPAGESHLAAASFEGEGHGASRVPGARRAAPNARQTANTHTNANTVTAATALEANTAANTEAATVEAAAPRPITHVAIAAIDLSSDVVPAGLLERDGGVTWDVPAFKIGHAETTAGAGESGNAVLLGHVTSVHSGNVFQDLDRVAVGDVVHVVADSAWFDYAVVSKQRIPRSDASVLEPGETPAISLITCSGIWLPTIWDYTERLVVRAELVESR